MSGMGFLLSYSLCNIYTERLILYNLPPKELIISSFLPVGPMAMTVSGVLNLATAASLRLPEYYQQELGVDGAARDMPCKCMWVVQTLIVTVGTVRQVTAGFASSEAAKGVLWRMIETGLLGAGVGSPRRNQYIKLQVSWCGLGLCNHVAFLGAYKALPAFMHQPPPCWGHAAFMLLGSC